MWEIPIIFSDDHLHSHQEVHSYVDCETMNDCHLPMEIFWFSYEDIHILQILVYDVGYSYV